MNKEKIKEIIENKFTNWKEKIEYLSNYLRELEDKYQDESNPFNEDLREFEIKAIEKLFYAYSKINNEVQVFYNSVDQGYEQNKESGYYVQNLKTNRIHNITEIGFSRKSRLSSWLTGVPKDYFGFEFHQGCWGGGYDDRDCKSRATLSDYSYGLQVVTLIGGYFQMNYHVPYIMYYDYLVNLREKGLSFYNEKAFDEELHDLCLFGDVMMKELSIRPWKISSNICKDYANTSIFFNATIENEEVDIWRVFKCYRDIYKPSIAVDETINCLNRIIEYNINGKGLHPLVKLESYNYYSG